jgi:hypothetical protein
MVIVVPAVLIAFSLPAMATTPVAGCGDDNIGDIGDMNPVVVTENQSSSYDFTHCFVGGNTTGWLHTESPAPAHGTLTINGSVVTYTPNPGYTGSDYYCLSCANAGNPSGNPLGSLAEDGALHDACGCNISAHFNVQTPAVATPALGTWGLFLIALLLLAMSLYRLRAWGSNHAD